MRLDTEDLTGLAALLTRRFSTAEERSELLRSAGLEDPGDWPTALLQAQEAGVLARLLRRAAQTYPGDENLQGVAATFGRPFALYDLVSGGDRTSRVAFAAAGMVLFMLIVGAIAWYGSADDKINRIVDEKTVDRPVAAVVAAPERLATPILAPPGALSPAVTTEGPQEAPEPAEQSSEAVEDPPPAEDAQPPVEEAAVPSKDAEVPGEEPAPAAEGTATVEGRCGGTGGDLVGYWYAGFPFEASQGEDYTVKYGANVREDYPRKANGWTVKTPLVCALRAGDVVHLSEAPILVDGGKYWVPLHAGDLKE